MATASKSFESILLDRSWVSPQDLDRARQRRKPGQELAEVLVEMGALEPQRLARALAQEYRIPFQAHIDEHALDQSLVTKVPINYAKKNHLLPLHADDAGVTVAIADPANYQPLDDLHILFGAPVLPVLAPMEVINEAINRAYDNATTTTAEELMFDLDEERLPSASELAAEPRDLLDADDSAPIIKLVNGILSQAVKDRASDIHIEGFELNMMVRFRVDGMLDDVLEPPKRFQPAITSRVKVMAGLNIAEKRLPQDGRIRLRIAGRDIDIRVSTIPTQYGERLVLRLLDRAQEAVHTNLDHLGFSGENLRKLDRLIRQSHGIILATGPTGSGKSTTLYACLSRINSPEKNIITIEDPIEYQLRGVGQMQVNPKIELTFANGLRSILRQDPDVIMVGEIRDGETAAIAIQSALTGHLVFSTLHTNDSFGAVSRLLEFGIEPYLVSSSILAVLAQRLVRRLCPECREAYSPTEAELARIGLDASHKENQIYRSKGCRACRNSG
ncbi:MAG TPA: ATPase, T2SS/T4P/T4SS family [Candidatus Binataceae bacterium]|nr:ATPase, T2SS/T4P/T4SS family [Candidatus Binataceae bacterium]